MSKRTYSANAQASINRFSSIIRDLELARHAVIALLESISSPIGVASLAGTAMGTAGEMNGRVVFPIETVWQAIKVLHREGLIVLSRRSLTPLIPDKEVPAGEYPLEDPSERWVNYKANLRQANLHRYRDPAIEARDEWFYEQCRKGTTYKQILTKLKTKPASWQDVETVQGLKKAAKKFASVHKLPPIPRRNRGRP